MTISVGGHAKGFTTSSNTTCTTGSFTSQASGSTFSVSVGWYGTAITPTISDNKGNTYSQVGSTVAFSGDALAQQALFECVNGAGGSGHTVTATYLTAADVITLFANEVLGALTVSPRDRAPGGNQDTTSPYLSALTGTTAQADELALAYGWTYTTTSPEALTWGNSFTAIDAQDSNYTGGCSSRVLTAVGDYQSSFTSSGGGIDPAEGAVTFIVTYKAIAASGAAASALFFGAGSTS